VSLEAAQKVLIDYFGSAPAPRTFEQWLDNIDAIIASERRRYLSASHNLHSLYLLRREPQMMRFYQDCDDWYIDGVPVRLVLSGFGIATQSKHRFTLMDHLEEMLQRAAATGWRVYFLGARQGVIERAQQLVAQRFPELCIQFHQGYFTDDEEVVQSINDYCPDVLLVGLGMPRQEQWLLRYLPRLDAAFVTTVGASMDHFTGAQARPPRSLSRIGLGGVYRLLHDPARLWRRYLVEPLALLPTTLAHWLRSQRLRRG